LLGAVNELPRAMIILLLWWLLLWLLDTIIWLFITHFILSNIGVPFVFQKPTGSTNIMILFGVYPENCGFSRSFHTTYKEFLRRWYASPCWIPLLPSTASKLARDRKGRTQFTRPVLPTWKRAPSESSATKLNRYASLLDHCSKQLQLWIEAQSCLLMLSKIHLQMSELNFVLIHISPVAPLVLYGATVTSFWVPTHLTS